MQAVADQTDGDDAPRACKYVPAWRFYNERRWALEKDFLGVDERAPFVCECTSGECVDVVCLTMFEFEAAHMAENWYAVLPGHMVPDDSSHVVVEHPHFWVVETHARAAPLDALRFADRFAKPA